MNPPKNILEISNKNSLIAFAFIFVGVYGLGLWHYGVFMRLAPSPFTADSSGWLQDSPIQYLIGYLLVKVMPAKTAYVLVLILGLTLIVGALILHLKRNKVDPYMTFKVVVLSPLLLVLTSWFGKSDLLLFSGFLIFINSKHFGEGIIGALIMVFSHFQIACFYFLFSYIIHGRDKFRLAHVLALIISISLFFYYRSFLPEEGTGRVNYINQNLREIILSTINNPIGHIVLTFNWLWLLIWSTRNIISKNLVLVAVIAFMVSLATLDFTRVFILLMIPALLVYITDRRVHEAYSKLNRHIPLVLLALFQLQIREGGVIVDTAWKWFYMDHFIDMDKIFSWIGI